MRRLTRIDFATGEYHSPNIAFADGGAGRATTSPSGTQGGGNAYTRNMAIRNLIVHGVPAIGQPPAVNMWQNLNAISPASAPPGTTLTQPLRNVGLVKRLLIKLNATVTAGATSTQTLTPAGLANLVSNVQFVDLANNTRINTSGRHLVWLSSVKRRRPWGAAMTTDTPFGMASTYVVNKAASSISANGNTAIQLILEVPFVRNDLDLRGVLEAEVSNATMQVQLTLNPNMFVASTGDPTTAMYQSAGSDLATLSAVSWTIYQNYLDQLPRDPNTRAPLRPSLDIGTAYVLLETPGGLPVVNQDYGIQFTNLRRFLSVMLTYDNAGVLNAGTDIAYMAVVSANFTNIEKFDPLTQALKGRIALGTDMPKGSYYLDFNDRPIDTSQYGNMQIIFNASSVGGSTANVLADWEAYGVIGLVNQGGSLPTNGMG